MIPRGIHLQFAMYFLVTYVTCATRRCLPNNPHSCLLSANTSMTWPEAEQFCAENNARLPFVNAIRAFLENTNSSIWLSFVVKPADWRWVYSGQTLEDQGCYLENPWNPLLDPIGQVSSTEECLEECRSHFMDYQYYTVTNYTSDPSSTLLCRCGHEYRWYGASGDCNTDLCWADWFDASSGSDDDDDDEDSPEMEGSGEYPQYPNPLGSVPGHFQPNTTDNQNYNGRSRPGNQNNTRSGSGNPNNGHSGPVNPNNGRSRPGNPDDGRSGPDNPNNGRSGSGNTDNGRSGPDNPNNGRSGSGNTDNGRSGPDNPNNGRSRPGNPDDGRSGPGNTDNGRPGPGNTDNSRSESDDTDNSRNGGRGLDQRPSARPRTNQRQGQGGERPPGSPRRNRREMREDQFRCSMEVHKISPGSSYSNWAFKRQQVEETEDCAVLDGSSLSWRPTDCRNKNYYICHIKEKAQCMSSNFRYVEAIKACLFISREEKDFVRAVIDCRIKGGDLVELTSGMWHHQTTLLISKNQSYWIGLARKSFKQKGPVQLDGDDAEMLRCLKYNSRRGFSLKKCSKQYDVFCVENDSQETTTDRPKRHSSPFQSRAIIIAAVAAGVSIILTAVVTGIVCVFCRNKHASKPKSEDEVKPKNGNIYETGIRDSGIYDSINEDDMTPEGYEGLRPQSEIDPYLNRVRYQHIMPKSETNQNGHSSVVYDNPPSPPGGTSVAHQPVVPSVVRQPTVLPSDIKQAIESRRSPEDTYNTNRENTQNANEHDYLQLIA